jgi:hypothetical protein
MQEQNLAWALAESADPCFRLAERNYIYVAIGAGDTFSAICALVAVIAREGLPLPLELVPALTSWLNAHSHNESEPRVRGLVTILTKRAPNHPAPAKPRREPLSIAQRYRRDAPADQR